MSVAELKKKIILKIEASGSTPYKLEQFLNLHTHKEWVF